MSVTKAYIKKKHKQNRDEEGKTEKEREIDRILGISIFLGAAVSEIHLLDPIWGWIRWKLH